MWCDYRPRLIGLLRAGAGSLCAIAGWGTPAYADVDGFGHAFNQLDRTWQLAGVALASGIFVLLLVSVAAALWVRRSRSVGKNFVPTRPLSLAKMPSSRPRSTTCVLV